MQSYNNRSEVPEKYKWDLSEYFQNEEDFNKSFKETEKLILELKNYKGCTKNPSKLYEFLSKDIYAISLWQNLIVYSSLINEQELGISKNIERENKVILLGAKFEECICFFLPELLKLSKKEYDNLFVKEKKLLEFKDDLDKSYREKKHTLSESEELIVSELVNSMNCYSNISSNLLNNEHTYGKIKFDDGKIHEIAMNNYNYLMRSKNREIRKKVYKLFNTKIDQYGQTSASLLNGYVKMNNSLAKIYHYKSSWDEKLFELNMSNKVFDTLISVTEKGIPVLQKYYNLKRKILNLDELQQYDMALDLVSSDKEYTIEEAQEVVRQSLKPLGKDYLNKYDSIIKNKCIDYCQYKGKHSGAFSSCSISKNSRILMSFQNNLSSLSTIAHESGHAVQSIFLNENVPLQYRQISLHVVEVASLTNEFLLSYYISQNSDDKNEKLAGINNILYIIINNLFGAVREGKMELDMYDKVLNGGSLTKDYLDELSYDSYKKYYGKSVKLNKFLKNNWVPRSHFYNNFYLFSYAICICVAAYVASKIIDGDKKMLDDYMKFLKTGSDKWPTEAFKILGINLEDENVYKNAIDYFDSLIDEFDSIYSKEV